MLALHPFKKIAKKAGVKRISQKGLEELQYTMTERAREICINAVKLCEHAHRRTIQEDDIDMALDF